MRCCFARRWSCRRGCRWPSWLRGWQPAALREPTFEFALGGIMWEPRHGSPDMWVPGIPGISRALFVYSILGIDTNTELHLSEMTSILGHLTTHCSLAVVGLQGQPGWFRNESLLTSILGHLTTHRSILRLLARAADHPLQSCGCWPPGPAWLVLKRVVADQHSRASDHSLQCLAVVGLQDQRCQLLAGLAGFETSRNFESSS